ncbi:MAG: DUF1540 domain-containing protein [Oscillospiraceae bacterium]|jgi:hypothetical protein|nr:DUF1540 domain-containing protein [Oscillospiraceae bacterium]
MQQNMQHNQTHGTAQPHNSIQCEVNNCAYNDQKQCTAKQIKVGPQYASSSDDTVCVTFKR